MDEKTERLKRLSVEQGAAIERLTLHGDWAFFQGYMESCRGKYLRKLLKEDIRNDGLAMARAAEGYDAINSIIEAIPKFIKSGHQAEKDIYEVEHGTGKDSGEPTNPGFEPTTGRSIK